MDKRLLMVLIFVFIGLSVLTYGYTQQGQNTIQNDTIQNVTQNNTVKENNEQINNVTDTTKDYDATITQKGPSAPQKRGTSVLIQYTVTNKGKNTIYNVAIGAQDFEKDMGTLKPGQTKKYTHSLYIPTDKDLAEWYEGGNVIFTNPLAVGSVILTFTDDKGVSHGVRSNQIEIKILD